VILSKLILSIALIFSFCNPAIAQNFHPKPQKITILQPAGELTIGETLNYSVEWLGIPVGVITLKVEGLETIKGHECYHISAKVAPNKFFRRMYDLEYTVHSYIDKQIYCTRRFEKVRRMDNDYNHIVIDFDQELHKAHFVSEGVTRQFNISPQRNKIEEKIPATSDIKPQTQDLLSSFFYFRFIPIKENSNYPVNIYYNQRNWQLNMQVGQPFVREIRKRGSFSVVQISPDSLLNNYILGKRKLVAYLTTDSLRIPIEFKLETGLGPICAKIQNSLKLSP
jgi:hypothetical protein